MKRFEGKVAVVTGGNSGIGLATAKRLHDEGAQVAVSGRSQKTLDEAAKLIGNVENSGVSIRDLDSQRKQIRILWLTMNSRISVASWSSSE